MGLKLDPMSARRQRMVNTVLPSDRPLEKSNNISRWVFVDLVLTMHPGNSDRIR
jgi:hypothetical protein